MERRRFHAAVRLQRAVRRYVQRLRLRQRQAAAEARHFFSAALKETHGMLTRKNGDMIFSVDHEIYNQIYNQMLWKCHDHYSLSLFGKSFWTSILDVISEISQVMGLPNGSIWLAAMTIPKYRHFIPLPGLVNIQKAIENCHV